MLYFQPSHNSEILCERPSPLNIPAEFGTGESVTSEGWWMMRYVIRLPDQKFVLLTKYTNGTKMTYQSTTADTQDATDFKSRKRANDWLVMKKMKGEVHELTDAGFWPVED